MAIACKQCSAALDDGATACTHCGNAVADIAAPSIEPAGPIATYSNLQTTSNGGDLEGIGGWLVLVAIGLAIAPFTCLHGLFTDLRALFGANYSGLFSSGPGIAILFLFETATNTVFLVAALVLNVMFYRKKRGIPVWMSTYLIAHFVAILIDQVGSQLLLGHSHPGEITNSFLGMAIWVPYLVRSRRVEATFTH